MILEAAAIYLNFPQEWILTLSVRKCLWTFLHAVKYHCNYIFLGIFRWYLLYLNISNLLFYR